MAKLTKEQKQQMNAWWDSLTNDEKRLFQIVRQATFLGNTIDVYSYKTSMGQDIHIPEIIPHEEA